MRERVFNPFRPPYVWLLLFSLLLGVVVAISEFRPSIFTVRPQIQQPMTMLAVGTFSSYLTAILVDGTFRQKEERDRKNLQNIALTELRNPLNRYLKVLRVWYRCSLNEPPESPPDSLQEVIDTGEIEKVRLLNFAETFPVHGRSDNYTFLSHSHQSIEQLQGEIDDVLQKYSPFLEPELVESLQELKDSDLFRFLITFDKHRVASKTDRYPLFAGDGYRDLQENLKTLTKVIEYYENPDVPDLTLLNISNMWRDDENPKIGSARIDVPFECVQKIELSDEPPYQVLGDEIWETIESCETE